MNELRHLKILGLLDNLFFVAKLNEAAKVIGAELFTARTVKGVLEKVAAHTPLLIVLDLDASTCQPFTLIEQLQAHTEWQKIPLLGFVAHVNTGIQEQARQAGCARVVARSVFSRDLPRLLQSGLERADQSH